MAAPPGLERWRSRLEWGVLALTVLLTVPPLTGCSTASDTAASHDPAASSSADPRREELPEIAPGDRIEDLESRLAGWPPGHCYTGPGISPAGWEWSGPDGMRVEAHVSGSLVVYSRVSRTWGSGAPLVNGRRLPGDVMGTPIGELERLVGPGLLVERTRALDANGAADPSVTDTYKWRIHDRGLDTGLFLTVHARDGVVAAVRHPWSRS